MRLKVPFFILLAWLACSSAGLRADGLMEQFAELTQPVQGLMRHAGQDPNPGALLVVVLILGLMPFILVIPMTFSCLSAGYFLPWGVAPWVILAGLLMNTLFAWSFARSVFGQRLEGWIERRGGLLARLRSHAREGGVKWTFLARFVPAPFIFTPMVMASAGVPLREVLLGTGAAMLPWSFIYAWVGRAGREGDLRSLGLAVTALVFLSALAFWLRKRYLGAADGVKP